MDFFVQERKDMNKKKLFACLAMSALILTGCGGDEEESSESSQSSQTPTSEVGPSSGGQSSGVAPSSGDQSSSESKPTSEAKAKYTITWKDADGSSIRVDKNVEEGTMPTPPADPSKAADAQYSYAFSGWSPAVSVVSGDAIYTATYGKTTNKYVITFKNGDDVLKSGEVEYGAMPVAPAAPSKDDTEQYHYTFAGWEPAVASVTGTATYNAKFNSEVRSYTVVWKDYDGDVIRTDENVEYGSMPVAPSDPSRDADAQYTYSFNGWDKAISAVHGNQEYVATYSSVVNKYTVTWKNWDGSVLETDTEVPYGTTPTYDGEDPTRAKTAETTYKWNKWESEVLPVNGNQTYVAHFDESKTKYTIAWKNWDDSTLEVTEPVVVDFDEVPVYPEADPECDEVSYLDYTFAGFEEVLPRDEENYIRTFKAKFDIVQTKDENFNFALINDNKEYKITGFSGSSREKLYIPAVHDDKPVTEIGSGAFSGNNIIKEVHIPDSIKRINYTAFYMNQYLETIDIKGSPAIDDNAFSYCYRAKSITVKGGSEYSIGSFAFQYAGYYLTGDDRTTIKLGEGITKLNYSAFYTSRASSVELPASLTIIDEYCFYYSSYLEEIKFAEGSKLEDIKSYSFYHCIALEEINFPAELKYIRSYAFQDCDSLTEVVIPDSVITLGSTAFGSCNSLAHVKLGKGLVASIEFASAFYDSAVEEYEVDGDHEYLSVEDGILFNKTFTQLLAFPKALDIKKYEIPSTVTSIAYFAFRYASYLEEVTTPSGLTSISYGAFQNCSKLSKVTFLGEVTSVASYAFEKTALTTVTFGTALSSLAPTAFRNCASLAEIVIPSENAKYAVSDKLVVYQKSKGDKVKLLFVLPAMDKTFTIPSTVTAIEENALAYSNVPSLTIPDTVTSLGQNAFMYSKIEEVVMGTGITVIPYQCFSYCSNIEEFEIPSSITEIKEFGFYYCTKLKSVELPDACTKIGEYSFSSCSKLDTLDLNKVETIGNYSFAYDKLLTEVSVPDTVKTFGSYAFNECTGITEATIACETIGAYAFYRNTALETVTLTDDVITIKGSAFQYDNKLLEVKMSANLKMIDEYAFYGCQKLGGKDAKDKEIGFEIPTTITAIGHYAFYECYDLHTLHFGGTKTEFIEAMTPDWKYDAGKYVGISSYFCSFSSSRVNRVVCSDGAGTISAKTTVVWDA